MEYSDRSLESGFVMGMERAGRRFNFDQARLVMFRRQLQLSLVAMPGEASDDFIELFSELATVAEISRNANEEPSLTEEDLWGFLAFSSWFFNSFKHK